MPSYAADIKINILFRVTGKTAQNVAQETLVKYFFTIVILLFTIVI